MTGVSTIYHRANADAPQGEEARRRNFEACKKAWLKRGFVAINPDDIISDWDRQAVINIANKHYGQRK